MITNLFAIANVKQLRTGGSFRILLPFFRKSLCAGVLNSEIFNSFHNRIEFGTILEGLRNFGWGGSWTPPPRHATAWISVRCLFACAIGRGGIRGKGWNNAVPSMAGIFFLFTWKNMLLETWRNHIEPTRNNALKWLLESTTYSNVSD